MGRIEATARGEWQNEAARLVTIDEASKRRKSNRPTVLPLAAIKQATAVFQVRHESIIFAPGSSEKHVRGLATIVRQGRALDPIKVVAFGDEWFLVDGHHRIEAYHRAGWVQEVPVEAIQSSLSGMDRVKWAAQISASENGKNRLNISDADRCDAAWRAVVLDHGSKSKTAKDFGVSETTVASMRKTKRTLMDLGEVSELTSYGWRNALWNANRREETLRNEAFDYEEAKRRKIARRLVPVLKMRPSAAMLLDLLEAARPGITIELDAAIAIGKEDRRWTARANSLEI